LHQLLNGNFAQALYFNWLAFVVAGAAVAVAIILAIELISRRRLLFVPKLQWNPRLVSMAAAALIALWVFQVSLAVGFHKHELLNPRGMLPALLAQ
jgi:hypothetical protein